MCPGVPGSHHHGRLRHQELRRPSRQRRHNQSDHLFHQLGKRALQDDHASSASQPGEQLRNRGDRCGGRDPEPGDGLRISRGRPANNTGSSSISSFNNLQEKVKATIHLGGFTESYVTSQNNKSGFAAVPNYSNGNFNTPGAIVRFNPTDGSLNTAIPFPNVLYLAMDPAEKHLLAFTNADDDAHWVDLTTIDSVTQVPMVSVLTITGLT